MPFLFVIYVFILSGVLFVINIKNFNNLYNFLIFLSFLFLSLKNIHLGNNVLIIFFVLNILVSSLFFIFPFEVGIVLLIISQLIIFSSLLSKIASYPRKGEIILINFCLISILLALSWNDNNHHISATQIIAMLTNTVLVGEFIFFSKTTLNLPFLRYRMILLPVAMFLSALIFLFFSFPTIAAILFVVSFFYLFTMIIHSIMSPN